MSAVTALRGSTEPEPGSCAAKSASMAVEAPSTAQAGVSSLWSELLRRARATWGMAMPIKAMGPQKAVTAPERRAEALMTASRVLCMRKPMLRA